MNNKYKCLYQYLQTSIGNFEHRKEAQTAR